MKRLIAVLLVLMLSVCAAAAEGLGLFEDYADALGKAYDAEWKEDGDIRILRIGEDTSVSACLTGKHVAAVTVEAMQGTDLREAAYAALAALGEPGSGVLSAIQDLEDVELTVDGCVVGHLSGETRECIYIASEEDFPDLIWEPVHGGDQLHAKVSCSGMDVPRLITAEAGALTGYDPCDHCMKDAEDPEGVSH